MDSQYKLALDYLRTAGYRPTRARLVQGHGWSTLYVPRTVPGDVAAAALAAALGVGVDSIRFEYRRLETVACFVGNDDSGPPLLARRFPIHRRVR